MKQCPTCRTTYTDDSLRFCLADGDTLVSVPDDDATLVKAKHEPVRVNIDSSSHRSSAPVEAAKPSTSKIVLVVGLFAVLILGAAGMAGALLYFNRDSRKADATTPTPVGMPSATPDLEKQKLQDQLANIQKQLDEQKSANKNTTAPPAVPPVPTPDTTGYVTARVNSPGDGFLALRDKPHAEFGNRVDKIPHGATVTIENCGPLQRRLGGRVGRWCMITYNGKTGYAFDAFLDRQ